MTDNGDTLRDLLKCRRFVDSNNPVVEMEFRVLLLRASDVMLVSMLQSIFVEIGCRLGTPNEPIVSNETLNKAYEGAIEGYKLFGQSLYSAPPVEGV